MQTRKNKLKILRYDDRKERMKKREVDEKMINKDKEPGVVYFKKLPEWVRKKYFEVIKGECQLCHKKMLYKDMEVHRIKSGQEGGLYTLCKLNHKEQNCKFIHSWCHKLLESNKRGHISHSDKLQNASSFSDSKQEDSK